MLIELGYSLGRWGADGDYGSATQRAVRAFQIDQRLQVDGIAGPQTIGALLDVFAHEDESDTGNSSGTDTPDEAEAPQEPQDDPQDAEKSEDTQDYTQGDDAAATPPEPPKPLEIGARTLRKGMSGDDVRELQSMLIELDYDLGRWGADGDFGSATEKAVKAYQKNNRLAVDGIAGPLTIGALLDVFAHEEAESEEAGPEEPEQAEEKAEEPTDPPKPAKEYPVHALDLSEYNAAKFSEIDWAGIRENVGFLIFRAGITREKTAPRGIGPDKYFARYAEKCREHGIPFWAYYYSRGSTMEQARAEAEYLFKTASPYGPVGYALDCEERGIKVAAFFARLYELGAQKTMLYIGHNWYPVYDLPVGEDGHIQCCDADWIPRYGKNDGTAKEKYRPKYPCDLWQYTSKFACDWIPDKTLDCNKLNGRRTLAWFRGEE